MTLLTFDGFTSVLFFSLLQKTDISASIFATADIFATVNYLVAYVGIMHILIVATMSMVNKDNHILWIPVVSFVIEDVNQLLFDVLIGFHYKFVLKSKVENMQHWRSFSDQKPENSYYF